MTLRRTESGSATIYVLVAVAVLALAACLGVADGIAAVARHRAEVAADAAALAAAGDVASGPAAACAAAARLARADGATLTDCRLAGALSAVAVAMPLPGWLSWAGQARGRARAGPA